MQNCLFCFYAKFRKTASLFRETSFAGNPMYYKQNLFDTKGQFHRLAITIPVVCSLQWTLGKTTKNVRGWVYIPPLKTIYRLNTTLFVCETELNSIPLPVSVLVPRLSNTLFVGETELNSIITSISISFFSFIFIWLLSLKYHSFRWWNRAEYSTITSISISFFSFIFFFWLLSLFPYRKMFNLEIFLYTNLL
jgi:hypothetical protein